MLHPDAVHLGAEAAHRLARSGCVQLEAPLSDAEFARVQDAFGFEFADDHRGLLSTGLPVGGRWPDWRNGAAAQLTRMLQWPVDGALFDVEHNAFWDSGWGERPAELATALQVARSELVRVPQLVPVYGHRYLPAGAGTFGHPVLSVYQTDIVRYGANLADYLSREFDSRPGTWQPVSANSTVSFWSALLE